MLDHAQRTFLHQQGGVIMIQTQTVYVLAFVSSNDHFGQVSFVEVEQGTLFVAVQAMN